MSETKWTPKEVSNLDMAFPANVREMMPKYEDIPDEFKRGKSKWIRFQQDWFFKGLKSHNLIPLDGIDPEKALRHLACIQRSFEPKHEHKEAAVAYLASLWFKPESMWEAERIKA